MVEPIFLIIGLVEANVEVAAAPHLGLQAIAGYGGIYGSQIGELGAEANIYVRRQMTGLHFGTELKYLWGSGGVPFVPQSQSHVTERELAIYAGYKWVGWKSITTVAQLGVARLDLSGDVPMDTKKTQIIPAANLVVGYSF
ncbi:hypothetical protein BH11MYX1_BH11MYX1_08980 [soil metagenome]